LKEDREIPSECPILDFYAITDADNAWKYFNNSSEIHKYRLPPDRNDLEVKFKDEKLNTPVLRMLESNNKISDTEACSAISIAQALGSLSLRVGFRDPACGYAFRRGGANVLQSILSQPFFAFNSS
jgi:hypothetical protein